MAQTRYHYPQGDAGHNQWVYELSLLTKAERQPIIEQSMAELAANHTATWQELLWAERRAEIAQLRRYEQQRDLDKVQLSLFQKS